MSAMPMETEVTRIEVGRDAAARAIAMRIFRAEPASALPALVWLGGYRSDMTGTKA
ncbi:MAG TPA: alpha/beta hydrolase, partial [Sinorhizobium sp.]|nr:alpha/beta hydrolase [Sinorhizobium sp.]